MSLLGDGYEGADLEFKRLLFLKRQRKRLYQRLSTFFYYHRHRTIRFVTLTSSPSSPDLRLAFQHLISKIRKTAPIDFVYDLKGKELFNYKAMLEPLKFEYIAVTTNEGCGVIHLIYVGDYIPFNWLQEQWMIFNNAYGVNIKKVDSVYNSAGLAGYIITQYVGSQSALRRFNWSKGAYPPDFIKVWRSVKRDNKGRGLERMVRAYQAWLDECHQQKLNIP